LTKHTNHEIPPTKHQAEAQAAFEAGIQLWKDAARSLAYRKFDEATRLDPAFASAHLHAVALNDIMEPPLREHLAAARAHRNRLTPPQVSLLDALEPLA